MLQRKDKTLRTCKELLLEFNKSRNQVNSSKIKFSLKQTGKDVYNITAPFLRMERLDEREAEARLDAIWEEAEKILEEKRS